MPDEQGNGPTVVPKNKAASKRVASKRKRTSEDSEGETEAQPSSQPALDWPVAARHRGQVFPCRMNSWWSEYLFCLQRPCFAVDTHIFRLCRWLGWIPARSNEVTAFSLNGETGSLEAEQYHAGGGLRSDSGVLDQIGHGFFCSAAGSDGFLPVQTK
jgi:hypothetical protein